MSGFNFKDLARQNPNEARRLAEAGERQMQRAATRSIMTDMPGVSDLSGVPFPERANPALKDYGFKHHSDVAKLTYRIGQFLDLPETVLTPLKGAGMFHDLGRSVPWGSEDPGHRERSAVLAEAAMRQDPQFWGDRATREEVCWLIANHRLGAGVTPPTDKRLIALWDAECFEQARFAVGTREGAQCMKSGFERCLTAWAQLPEHQQTWRHEKGWR
jgi:hypothetical protein